MASPEAERVKAWRVSNPERYRDYQRELMRRRREKARTPPPAGVLAPVQETK